MIFISLLFWWATQKAHAAACCGGGLAAPSLILSDDKALVTASYTYGEIKDDISDQGLWEQRQGVETSQIYRLAGAHIFADRWQAGFSAPVVTRQRDSVSSTGFGDASANLGYEYLPDWDYSVWRPKGLGYLQLTLPSGRSADEAEAAYELDSRGRGFWALGLGTVLSKFVGRYDFYFSVEGHRSLAKSFSNSQASGELQPGFGASWGPGIGYNLDRWRFGGSLVWTYEDPIHVTGTIDAQGAAQRYATASLSASYLFEHEWTATVLYSDQTLFGDPSNTTLMQAVLVQVQKRWLR